MKRFSFKFVTREGSAFMVGTHIVGGIIAGLLVGYFFDKFFKTPPWGLFFFFLVGIVAGFKNAYGEMKKIAERGEEKRNS